MQYQKIINMLDNAPNQPSMFRTKNRVEMNDDSRETYNTDSKIKLITSLLKCSLCNYSDACILVSGTIKTTAAGDDTAERQPDKRNEEVICALIGCISEINNSKVDHAKDLDVVMLMYNLI